MKYIPGLKFKHRERGTTWQILEVKRERIQIRAIDGLNYQVWSSVNDLDNWCVPLDFSNIRGIKLQSKTDSNQIIEIIGQYSESEYAVRLINDCVVYLKPVAELCDNYRLLADSLNHQSWGRALRAPWLSVGRTLRDRRNGDLYLVKGFDGDLIEIAREGEPNILVSKISAIENFTVSPVDELKDVFTAEQFKANRDGVVFLLLREHGLPARKCAAILNQINEVFEHGS